MDQYLKIVALVEDQVQFTTLISGISRLFTIPFPGDFEHSSGL